MLKDRYIDNGDCVEIIIFTKGGGQKYTATIDKEDYEIVSSYPLWSTNHRGYVKCISNGKQISLHRLVMNFPANKEVVFINGNTLDCRKKNLASMTKAESNRYKAQRRYD